MICYVVCCGASYFACNVACYVVCLRSSLGGSGRGGSLWRLLFGLPYCLLYRLKEYLTDVCGGIKREKTYRTLPIFCIGSVVQVVNSVSIFLRCWPGDLCVHLS